MIWSKNLIAIILMSNAIVICLVISVDDKLLHHNLNFHKKVSTVLMM